MNSSARPAPHEQTSGSDIDDTDELPGADAALPPIRLMLTSSDAGERLDRVLARMLPNYSRSRLQQWIEDGLVTVDGQQSRSKTTVFGDEEIVVNPQPAPDEVPYLPEPMALDIVHEDEDILVLDKTAGLVVHPAAGNWSGTLLNGLLHHCPGLAGVPRAGIVHRLDKDTSGLMVVAKTIVSQTDLVRQLQARTVRRQYLALVWGTPHVSGTVDAPMARHSRDRLRMAVSNGPAAKAAVTHYRRLAVGQVNNRPVALMHCRLETGRTHQIRVHFQSIGFSLVGDPLYGKPHLTSVFPRQALHAWQLGFDHPSRREAVQWRAEPPEDLRTLLQRAGITSWADDKT